MAKGVPRDDLAALDERIGVITADVTSDDEKLRAFRQAFDDQVALPADRFVVGQPVSVLAIDYGGNARRGLPVISWWPPTAGGSVSTPTRTGPSRHRAATRWGPTTWT